MAPRSTAAPPTPHDRFTPQTVAPLPHRAAIWIRAADAGKPRQDYRRQIGSGIVVERPFGFISDQIMLGIMGKGTVRLIKLFQILKPLSIAITEKGYWVNRVRILFRRVGCPVWGSIEGEKPPASHFAVPLR